MVQLLLFLTPVIYPVSMVKNEWIKMLLSLNPMALAINFARFPFTNNFPATTEIFLGLFSTFLLFIIGLYIFKKTEDYFADIA